MTTHPDLGAIARRAAREEGFVLDFPPAVAEELQSMNGGQPSPLVDPPATDLRSLLWSSIDNSESRDLDQVEYVEPRAGGGYRLLVGIADVDEYVPKGSAIDAHAAENCTSVYTGVRTFPMLPEQLSTGVTSLLGGEDRLAIIIEMMVNSEGAVESSSIYRGRLHNYARLSYDEVGEWLDHDGPMPDAIRRVQGMAEQMSEQVDVTRRLRAHRLEEGALEFETIEATPVMSDGKVTSLAVTRRNTARDLIENFMIAANSSMAAYLEAKGRPCLLRVVREPERWPRIVEIAKSLGDDLPAEPDARALAGFLERRRAADPDHFPDLSLAIVKLLGPGRYDVEFPGSRHEGHFGLALRGYAHSTAPNRRYADLLTQRLVKAAIAGQASPYTVPELEEFSRRCTEREDAARKVERRMRKAAAAVLLGEHLGEQFDAIVTGVSAKGTFARLIAPPADGMVVRGARGVDVGDRIRVRLVSADPERGFIDFERLPGFRANPS